MNMLGKPLFLWSDLHIGHENAIKFDRRPFRDLNHMHETLITRYNSTVPENGVCFFIGDIGNKPEEIRRVISRMHGTKVCFLGNHDKGMGTMYNCGFDVVLWGGVMYINDIRVTISHCPLIGVYREDTESMGQRKRMTEEERRKSPKPNWHGENSEKHLRFATKDDGQYHVHGHTHCNDEWKLGSKKVEGRQFDVGVPGNNYTPVNWTAIVSWVMKRENREMHNEG